MEALSIKDIVNAVHGRLISGDLDSIVTSVSTNSKEINQNALFVPIIGERVDAHDFIDSAFMSGAVATFTSRKITPEQMKEGKAYIEVTNTLEALQSLASYYRNKFDIPVIGITGSVGKTTTKEMIAAVLETKYQVLKTAGNMNSQVGLPLTILRLEKSHEVAVIEMGMSEVGEMGKLAKIARPNIAVVTNIGVSHIGQLKTQSNIRKEKMNLLNEFTENSCLYLNANDNLLEEVVEVYGKETENKDKIEKVNVDKKVKASLDFDETTREQLEKTFIYSYGTTATSDYKATNIETKNGEIHFTFEKENKNENNNEEIILRVLGMHNVYNALVALAIGEKLSIPASLSKQGLYQYQPIAMRGQIHEIHGIKVIDDTYNASPDSVKGAIGVLLDIEQANRRIAVLADIFELGDISYQCHYDIGDYAADTALDEVITIGNDSPAIVEAIKDKKANIITHSFDKNEEAVTYLKSIMQEKDAILVKGSRGMHTDEIVKALLD